MNYVFIVRKVIEEKDHATRKRDKKGNMIKKKEMKWCESWSDKSIHQTLINNRMKEGKEHASH